MEEVDASSEAGSLPLRVGVVGRDCLTVEDGDTRLDEGREDGPAILLRFLYP